MCNSRNSKRLMIDGREVRLDRCLFYLVDFINSNTIFKTISSCCGHGRYDMSIVVRAKNGGEAFDLISNKIIPRKRKFYKKDSDGYYYIPEALKIK